MLSTTARKKPKLVDTETVLDHSLCALHKESDHRKTICNGFEGTRQQCKIKVEGAQSEAYIKQRRLPVCGIHSTQHLTLGYCEVVGSCGLRCNRLIYWKPCENQLCELHQDAKLACHLLKLPLELRIMIFELAVSAGPRKAVNYCIAAALLRLNKQISSDVSVAIYKSRQKPCNIKVDDFWVKVPWATFVRGRHNRRTNGTHSFYDIVRLNSWAFVRFEHFKITIKLYNDRESSKDNFLPLLENFRQVINALKDYNKRKVSIATISIVFKFIFTTQSTGILLSRDHVPAMLAIVKALLNALKSVGTIAHKVLWKMRIKQWRAYSSEPKQCSHLNIVSGQLAVCKGNIDATVQDAIKAEVPGLEKMLETSAPEQFIDGWTRRWNVFQKIHVICDILLTFGSIRSAAYIDSRESRQRILAAAGVALENMDDTTLSLILKDLQSSWQGSQKMWASQFDPMDRIVNHPSDEALPSDALRKFANADFRSIVEWPPPRYADNFPASEAQVEDFVYEKAEMDGKTVYRLITPDIASDRYRASLD